MNLETHRYVRNHAIKNINSFVEVLRGEKCEITQLLHSHNNMTNTAQSENSTQNK